MLHKTVIFIGDEPSKKNLDPDIPFVGTQSYKNLLNWIWEMDLDINNIKLENKNQIGDFCKFCSIWGIDLYNSDVIRIALGNNAAKELDKFGFQYFKLLHPSPKNRKLNDKKYIKNKLKKCKEYIYGGK